MSFFSVFGSPLAFKRAWKPSGDMLGRFLSLGWPKSLELLATTTPFSVFALLAGWIGVQAVAAYTIAWQTALMVSFTLSWAVADTVTIGVSTALARKDHAGMWRALNSGVMILLVLLSSLIAIFLAFPEWIVMLFIGSEAPKDGVLFPLASSLIVLVGFFVLADGLRMIHHQALNGLADMKVPALIVALAYWGISLPIGVLLGFAMDFGVRGFWMGLILGMAVAAVGYLIRFRRLVRIL